MTEEFDLSEAIWYAQEQQPSINIAAKINKYIEPMKPDVFSVSGLAYVCPLTELFNHLPQTFVRQDFIGEAAFAGHFWHKAYPYIFPYFHEELIDGELIFEDEETRPTVMTRKLECGITVRGEADAFVKKNGEIVHIFDFKTSSKPGGYDEGYAIQANVYRWLSTFSPSMTLHVLNKKNGQGYPVKVDPDPALLEKYFTRLFVIKELVEKMLQNKEKNVDRLHVLELCKFDAEGNAWKCRTCVYRSLCS